MTDAELQKLCRAWQKRLRLSDWKIAVKYASAEEFGGDTYGDSDWFPEEMTATIRVLRDSGCEGSTLVHELLHIRNEGHKPVRAGYDRGYETGLNVVAELLWSRFRPRKSS